MASRIILDPKQLGKSQIDLESAFRELMVGQERAIKHLVRRILYANSMDGRLRDPTKPAGSFFYLGPTGVGKTRLVEVFAYLLFGQFDAMVKVDCSELQHSHEIARLIGSPPGYVGSHLEPWLSQRRLDQWGFFKEKYDSEVHKKLGDLEKEMEWLSKDIDNIEEGVAHKKELQRKYRKVNSQYGNLKKRQEYQPGAYPAILLFDEIEKAHPVLFDLLLQIHDKAKLTTHGNVPGCGSQKEGTDEVLFHNTFIFYTSNIAQDQIRKFLRNSNIGFSSVVGNILDQRIYLTALGQMEKFFSSEFLGRIRKENIIVFSPLDKEKIKEGLERIVIPGFFRRLVNPFGCSVIITDQAKEFLVDESFDAKNKTFGMRALESTFIKQIEEPLTGLIQKTKEEGGIIAGDEILIGRKGEELVFSISERTSEQQKNEIAERIQINSSGGDRLYNERILATFKIK